MIHADASVLDAQFYAWINCHKTHNNNREFGLLHKGCNPVSHHRVETSHGLRMQLVLHTGAHFTEQERLIKTVLRNSDISSERGVHVPGPSSYRSLMRDTLNAMGKNAASPQAREVLLDVMLDGAKADRLVLSDANFFRTAGTGIQGGVLYPACGPRLAHMAHLFPDDDIEVFLGLRNPAALIPLFFQNAVDSTEGAFWDGGEPQDILWSETIARIRDALPDAPITVWCAEDLPLIWSQVVREMLDLVPDQKITGAFDLLYTIMSKEGMERFRAYLNANPEMTEAQKRRVISAFLEKFALDEELEEEVNMPGWSEALVDTLTNIYERDIEVVARMPGVRMLTP